MSLLLPESIAGARRYSLALIAGAAIALALLPVDVWLGPQPLSTPASAPRVVDALARRAPDGSGFQFSIREIANPAPSHIQADPVQLFLIDGNRDGRLVVFGHDFHRTELGGDDSCALCHHQAFPYDQNTSCHQCHRDMYVETDIFDHSSHVEKLGDNGSCLGCHSNQQAAKGRDTAKSCSECHAGMLVAGSTIAPPPAGMKGYAVGYMDAMHGLCIDCHRQKLEQNPMNFRQDFADCATCHRDVDGTHLRRMSPYLSVDSAGRIISADGGSQ